MAHAVARGVYRYRLSFAPDSGLPPIPPLAGCVLQYAVSQRTLGLTGADPHPPQLQESYRVVTAG